MKTSHALGIACALVLAPAAVACGSDPSTLGGGDGFAYQQQHPTGGGPDTTATTPTGSPTTTGTIAGGPVPTGTTTSTGTAPGMPPPGVTSPTAKQFFDATVYPSLMGTCGGCHASPGSAGAPAYLDKTSADNSYATVEARGYISSTSMLLKKGAHEGPALTSAQQMIVEQWITLEEQVRGTNTPDNILSKLGNCVDPTLFASIGLKNLKTTPRTNENPNRCTGCDNAICQSCHEQGEYAMHSNFGDLGMDTIQALQTNGTSPEGIYLIEKYVTTNGTQLIPSTAIADKGIVTQTGTAYSHPMFTVPPTMVTAIAAFSNDIITKYNAKTCGQ